MWIAFACWSFSLIQLSGDLQQRGLGNSFSWKINWREELVVLFLGSPGGSTSSCTGSRARLGGCTSWYCRLSDVCRFSLLSWFCCQKKKQRGALLLYFGFPFPHLRRNPFVSSLGQILRGRVFRLGVQSSFTRGTYPGMTWGLSCSLARQGVTTLYFASLLELPDLSLWSQCSDGNCTIGI